MGEYAEMMLDGTCCSQCGEYLFDDGAGYPVMCATCAANTEEQAPRYRPAGRRNIPCADCGKYFRTPDAVAQHARDKHGTQ